MLHVELLLPHLLLQLQRLVPILFLGILQLVELLPHLLDLEGGRHLSLLARVLALNEGGHLTLELLHLVVLLLLHSQHFLIGTLLLLERGEGLLEHGDLAENFLVHLVGLRLFNFEDFKLLLTLVELV